MRRALYQINREYVNGTGPDDIIIVFLDSDVVPNILWDPFRNRPRGTHGITGYDFAKASFWRAMGRVKKFVAQPLFSLLIDHPRIAPLSRISPTRGGGISGFFQLRPVLAGLWH